VSTPTDFTPGAAFADYVIDREFGRGGMSIVYRARERMPDRYVALKVLASELAHDDTFRKPFLAEPNLAAAIGHPNIIPIFDSGEAEGCLFMAMPLIDNGDLDSLIRREGWLRVGRTAAIISQAARGLHAAHSQGLVHRDIKPANLLLSLFDPIVDEEHVYLADFGLAKRTEAGPRFRRESFMGTREYAAPEQIRGKRVDARTDVYALGCVIHECLTGVPPFADEDPDELVTAHLEREPPPVTARRPDLGPGIDAVVAKALAKDPDDRFDSAPALAAALRVQAAAAVGRESEPPGVLRARRGRAVTEVDTPPATEGDRPPPTEVDSP
jgi:serine/threonine protein kinase